MRILLLLLLPLALSASAAQKPNVLFIAVDDWNDWVGCLGDKQAITPNVDSLASEGLLFKKAYTAVPVCNPSRVSVLTGMHPDTTKVYENGTKMRRAMPDAVTIPQYFRKHGYITHGGGKIFHDVTPHHDPKSFDEYYFWHPNGSKGSDTHASPYSAKPDPEPNPRPHAKVTKKTKRNFDWAALDGPESNWPDHKVATWAEGFLKKKHDKPFFLAVGIFRPHIPWYNPKKYYDMYDLDKIQLPKVLESDHDDLGEWARKRALDRNSKHDKVQKFGEWKNFVRAYLASISFADAQVGRVLDALKNSPYADNTIIVFWSDHGYHLGEKGHWHKRTLWERATHVPFIVKAPGMVAGKQFSHPVSLIDIYPTLNDLCGLAPKNDLQGESLLPFIKNPSQIKSTPAITTYKPGNYAVRSDHFRYIVYATGEEEFYDHRNDSNEWHNMIANPEYKAEVEKHRKIIRQHKKAQGKK